MPQVSVIVSTYNPDITKLKQTLSSAVNQKDVDFEIIISDDGSTQKDFSFLAEFMKSYNIKNYILLDHKKNLGTVKNCLSAVRAACGEYVFMTSPGDFLYDSHVLRDFYDFARMHEANLCFGNTVFYKAKEPILSRKFGSPAAPTIYAPGASISQIKACFLGGNWVIGASYFRQRQLFLTALEAISDTAIYMEDTTSTAYALANNERLSYFNRNIVWYEDGSGISTGKSDKWTKLLHSDLVQSLTKLKTLFPTDPYIDICLRNATVSDRTRRLLGNFLRHPLAMVRIAHAKQAKKVPIQCSQEDLKRLSQLLKIK